MRAFHAIVACILLTLTRLAAAAEPEAIIQNERHQTFSAGPGVRAHLISPLTIQSGKPVHLVIYALPNGNTIEETLGRAVPPGDKTRYGIQQIAAQTRFLRAKVEPNLVVACLEARGLAWPTWRKRNGDAAIPRIVESLVARCAPAPVRVSLSGHSGGGSFIFGYINAHPEIPSRVERIAFLDANYGYETEKHAAKLVNWLNASENHYLCVLAYRDDLARWEGKPFVSKEGGTGGRSRAMIADLHGSVGVRRGRRGDIDTATALGGRVQFLIHRNPDAVILHTVQVEKNGFIHASVAGTRHANRGYRYMGEPAYGEWITAD